MGLKINIAVFILTIGVTLSTTALMCMCVVTDYWEIVSYPMTSIEKILNESKLGIGDSISDVSVESLFQEKVTVIKEKTETKQIMIQMHAGLWSICYDVAGNLICFYFLNSFPIKKYIANYSNINEFKTMHYVFRKRMGIFCTELYWTC